MMQAPSCCESVCEDVKELFLVLHAAVAGSQFFDKEQGTSQGRAMHAIRTKCTLLAESIQMRI
jgi:hypothetical protein